MSRLQSTLPDFFNRTSRADSNAGEIDISGLDAKHSYGDRRGSADSLIKVPKCCELKILDFLISTVCILILTITIFGYVVIASLKNSEEGGDLGGNSTAPITTPDYPIAWNESQVIDGDFHEFFLRCRSYRYSMTFKMGCEQLEPHLVMKDTTPVSNTTEN